MTSNESAHLIDDYLGRLEVAARVLPAAERAELLAQFREHLAVALPEGADEAAVRTVLDRLGPPEEIVPAPGQVVQVSASPRVRSITLEVVAVVLLTAGSLLPLVGWLVGAVLLWSSDRWRTREKVIGTLLVPGGLGGLLIAGGLFGLTAACEESTLTDPSGNQIASTSTCDDQSLLTHLLPFGVVFLLIASLVVPFWLLHVARRRAGAEAGPAFRRAVQPIG